MNMSATTVEEVHRLWKIGNELRVAQTPPSFQRLMASRLLRPLEKANASTLNAAKSLAGAVCCHVKTLSGAVTSNDATCRMQPET